MLAPQKTLSAVSNAILRSLRILWHFVVEAYAWLGALLLGPLIRRVLREKGLAQTYALMWTAGKRRIGQQGSDFLKIAQEGYRVAGARFVVRPDYRYSRWHAGFRLTPATENFETADLRATVLFDMEMTGTDAQARLSCHREGMSWGPWDIPSRWYPKPSFTVELSVYPSVETGKLHVTMSVDGNLG